MILIIKNHKIIIDDEDYNKIKKYKWYVYKNNNCFYTISETKPGIRMHRLIMSAKKGQIVDHINRNGLDNRKCNLRLCSIAENSRNKKKPKTNTSGYKGVSFKKSHNKWQATIKVNKKIKHLGYFDNPKKAYHAYCKAAKKYHGEFARIA